MISPDHTLTAFTVDKAMQALSQAARSQAPFAITCSIIYPHNPWIVAEPWYSLYPPERFSPPATYRDSLEGSPWADRRQFAATYYPQEFEHGLGRFMSIYYGAVAEIDFHVGRLLRHLEELNLADNTVVAFVSDHGEMLGAHGMIAKGTFFEEAVRIPMIIRTPDGTVGQVCGQSVNQVDLVATFCDYCGVASTLTTHGRSLRPLICGDHGEPREFSFSELENGPAEGADDLCGSRMMRSPDWKYILRRNGREGLYHLRKDPGETSNLMSTATDEAVATQYRRMQGALLDYMLLTCDPAADAFRRLHARKGSI